MNGYSDMDAERANGFRGLDSQDMEHLIDMIEASLSIHKRTQFFLWAQGALQGFIPHELLICAHGDVARMRLRHEVFSSLMIDPEMDKAIADPVNGLLARIADEWLRGGSTPRLFSPGGAGQVGRRQLLADIQRRGFAQVVAHGPKEVQGEFGSFFVFARLPQPPTPREAYMLELLVPYLHMALYRMLAGEAGGKLSEVSAKLLLSKREIQVLHWVKNGKTNHDIAQILDLAPNTVKNHVQKILRKLKVSNRAEAVGKIATLRLISPGDLN